MTNTFLKAHMSASASATVWHCNCKSARLNGSGRKGRCVHLKSTSEIQLYAITGADAQVLNHRLLLRNLTSRTPESTFRIGSIPLPIPIHSPRINHLLINFNAQAKHMACPCRWIATQTIDRMPTINSLKLKWLSIISFDAKWRWLGARQHA